MTEQTLNTETKPALPLWARILLIMISYLIVGGIFQIFGMLVTGISLTDVEALKNVTPAQQLILQFSGFLALIPTVYLFRKYVDRQSIKSMGFVLKNRLGDLLYGFLIALAIIGGGSLLLYVMGYIEVVSMKVDINSLVLYFLILLFVSLNEEILMRGYILNNLMIKMNKYWALLISAVIFALFHGLNFNMSWMGMFNLMLAGIFLGAAYIFTKNLWFPISLHLFWNFFQGPIMGFQVSGNEMDSLISLKTIGDPLMHGGKFGYEGSIVCSILVALTSVLIIAYYQKRSAKQPITVEA